MALIHQQLFAPPSSNNFDRVLNWCEREVKNFYELPTRVEPYKGVRTNAVLDNNRIDRLNLPKLGSPRLPDTILNARLDVHQ